jgi:hypothetical protein
LNNYGWDKITGGDIVMKKIGIVSFILLAILIGGFLFYNYHVGDVKKDMEQSIVKYLELHGENRDNIKEIDTEIYWLKNFKFIHVIFEDEKDITYTFEYGKNSNETKIKYAGVKTNNSKAQLLEFGELKHQNLMKEGWFNIKE